MFYPRSNHQSFGFYVIQSFCQYNTIPNNMTMNTGHRKRVCVCLFCLFVYIFRHFYFSVHRKYVRCSLYLFLFQFSFFFSFLSMMHNLHVDFIKVIAIDATFFGFTTATLIFQLAILC